jgi:phage tail sheath protein FI
MRQLVGLAPYSVGGPGWMKLNTAETMAASGVLYINYDFGPKSPTELISLRVRVNNNYALEEMLAA